MIKDPVERRLIGTHGRNTSRIQSPSRKSWEMSQYSHHLCTSRLWSLLLVKAFQVTSERRRASGAWSLIFQRELSDEMCALTLLNARPRHAGRRVSLQSIIRRSFGNFE